MEMFWLFLWLLNLIREPDLTISSELEANASIRASQLAELGALDHHAGFYSINFPVNCWVYGENIGRVSGSVWSIFQKWFESESHHWNLVNPIFNKVGFGSAYDSDGVLYVVYHAAQCW